MERDAVIATREVALGHWLRPFDDVLADAKAGTRGLRAVRQESDKSGRFAVDKQVYIDKVAVLIRQPGTGSCELYQQGWDDENFTPKYAPWGQL